MDPILSVRNLRTEFHAEDYVVRAVDGLSYDLYPGKTLAVVGESGSGKSAHALSILRLLPPSARITDGEVIFADRDLLKMDPEKLRALRGNRIGMVFQEPMTSLNPVMRVGDQIAEALILHRKLSKAAALEKAGELLAKVGIPAANERLKDYPHQFSGGMRQRVMIGIALACDPDILIADEPTTALDVTIQAQILELIKGLQRELNMALILITHNIGVVAQMADDVVVMYAGRAVESAPVSALFAEPLHPYTRALLDSVPSISSSEERLAAIPGHPPELTRAFRACPYAERCASAFDLCRREDPPDFILPGPRMANCWLREEQAQSVRRRVSAAPV